MLHIYGGMYGGCSGVIETMGAGRTRGVGGRVALGTEAATTANSMSFCGYCLLL